MALGIVSFFAVLMSALLAPGTIVNRALSAALCTVFSFNSTICTVNLAKSSDRVVAATPPAVERNISDWLVQRDPGEFGDAPSVRPGSNPQVPPFPQNPGPNQPVRPDFDNPGSGQTPNVPVPRNISFQDDGAGNATFTLVDPNGCSRKYDFKSDGNKSHIESVTLDIPINESNVCNNLSTQMYAKFTPDGKEVIFSSSNNAPPVKIQGIDGRIWTITYTDESGKRMIKQVSLEVIGQSEQPKQVRISREFEYNQSKIHKFASKSPIYSDFFILAKLDKDNCESLRSQCEQGLWVKKNLEPIIKSLTGELKGLFVGFVISKSLLGIVISLALNVLPEISSLECTTLFGDKYASSYVNDLRKDNKNIKDWMDKNRKSPDCEDHSGVVTARISQVDDVARIYIDGKIVFEGFYAYGGKGGDTGWQPINVGSGRHQVRLVVENTYTGESGGWFEIKVNGELKINQGRPFQKDRITGIKYDQTTTLEVP
ncbi:hypothetical protein [Tychonema sp. BBK16]|uniref:hypothetical protein n=1 Tax=Tychonema sp. BBK16 TaxID=2699888 RepID=UPI001F1DF8E3|nr:hypothetical protein [Tychonema sp. BBK16]MCF6374660.1 hypothetical protein [Tychonema sp. BBK16]